MFNKDCGRFEKILPGKKNKKDWSSGGEIENKMKIYSQQIKQMVKTDLSA